MTTNNLLQELTISGLNYINKWGYLIYKSEFGFYGLKWGVTKRVDRLEEKRDEIVMYRLLE